MVLHPNEAGGVEGILDDHGLLAVRVTGTVHRPGVVVGVFEQEFGLSSDPFQDGDWRIKYTNLLLRIPQSTASAILTLEEVA